MAVVIFTVTIPNGGNESLLNNEQNEKRFGFQSEEVGEDDAESVFSASFYGEHGTPAPDRSNASDIILRVTTAYRPQNAERGFVFGRNPALCDILLDHPSISEEQFAMKPRWEHSTMLLINYSARRTDVAFKQLKEKHLLRKQRVFAPGELAKIRLGNGIQIHIEGFDETREWKDYCRSFISPDPTDLDNVAIEPVLETTDASKRAPVYIQGTRLGKGANAEVFAAIEKYTAMRYAVKVFKKAGRWREPEILDTLKHTNIVRYVAYIRPANQSPQLIMELVNGPDLQKVLQQPKDYPELDIWERRDILSQLLDAICYVHRHGIIHRDLKPANILVARRNPLRIKLADFGEATTSQSFKPKNPYGTPLYAAPEMIHGRECTAKADMFSVGVIALQLLYGLPEVLGKLEQRRQATTSDLKAILGTILHWRDSQLATHRTLMLDFVCRLLQEKPRDRHSADESLQHGFFHTQLDDVLVPTAAVSDLATQIYHPNPPRDYTNQFMELQRRWAEDMPDTMLGGPEEAGVPDSGSNNILDAAPQASPAALQSTPAVTVPQARRRSSKSSSLVGSTHMHREKHHDNLHDALVPGTVVRDLATRIQDLPCPRDYTNDYADMVPQWEQEVAAMPDTMAWISAESGLQDVRFQDPEGIPDTMGSDLEEPGLQGEGADAPRAGATDLQLLTARTDIHTRRRSSRWPAASTPDYRGRQQSMRSSGSRAPKRQKRKDVSLASLASPAWPESGPLDTVAADSGQRIRNEHPTAMARLTEFRRHVGSVIPIGEDRPACPQQVANQHLSNNRGFARNLQVVDSHRGLHSIKVNDRNVTMDASDFRLNASQIYAAAAAGPVGQYLDPILSRSPFCDSLRHLFSKRAVSRSNWLPFRDGCFLSQALGLDSELAPLFSYANEAPPRREDNYLLPQQQALWHYELDENSAKDAPPGQGTGGDWYSRQNDSAGVDQSHGEALTGPATQAGSQSSGLSSFGDPLHPLAVGSFIAAWGRLGEDHTARTVPPRASIVEEDDELPPPWSPAHPSPSYAAVTHCPRPPSHGQNVELPLATYGADAVTHLHLTPFLAEEGIEDNGDWVTLGPAPYVGHAAVTFGSGGNRQQLEDDVDEGATDQHETADGVIDDYTPPEPPSSGSAAIPGSSLPREYRGFHVDGSPHAVVCMPRERTVNAGQLVRTQNVSKKSLARCFKRHPEIRSEKVIGPGLGGRYVDFNDARTICRNFHIPMAIIDQLEAAAAAATAASTAAASTAAGSVAITDGGGRIQFANRGRGRGGRPRSDSPAQANLV